MACNKCWHTKSSPCACNDHGLTTPCSYTNCTTSACEEIYCTDCVVDCFGNPSEGRYNKVWCAEPTSGSTADPDHEIRVCKADSITTTLQRIALYVTDPAGTTVSTELAIAPFWLDNILSTSLKLNWDNMPITVSSIAIYQAPETSTAWTLVTTLTVNLANTKSYSITNLTPDTNYKYKLISTGLVGGVSSSANSVVAYVRTPIS